MDSFLAIAEEMKLKGLTNQTSNDLLDLKETIENPKAVKKSKEMLMKSATSSVHPAMGNSNATENVSTALTIPNEFSEDLQGLDEKVKSLMEKSQNMIQAGKRPNGAPRQEMGSICKVCRKEGLATVIRNHIETYHLEGISIPCAMCENVFTSRHSLSKHKSRCHRSQT